MMMPNSMEHGKILCPLSHCTVSDLGQNRPLNTICEFGKSYTFNGLNGSQHIEA